MRQALTHLGPSAPKTVQHGWRFAGFTAKPGSKNPHPAGTLANEEWQHGYETARLTELQAPAPTRGARPWL